MSVSDALVKYGDDIGKVFYKAVNRGDKRTRRVRDRDFVKFERSRRYRDRYRCQEKKSRRGRARDLVFLDPPRRERALDRCSRIETPPPPLMEEAWLWTLL
jgi:hypothetical protein